METTVGSESMTHVPRWSSLLIRGIASVLFAIGAFGWPGVTLAALTLLFGAYAFVDGIAALVVAATHTPHKNRWLLLLDGLVGIGAGVATLFWPGITLLALVFIIGFRFVISGGLQIASAIEFRDLLRSPVLYGIAGACSLVLGILAFVVPGVTALALVTMLGAFMLVFGLMLIALAFRVRSVTHRLEVAHAPA